MLRVLSISTLYPHDGAPNFGVFVERQMQAVTRQEDAELLLINPVGLPPWPLSLHPRYRALHGLPQAEMRGGVNVLRPRFPLIPGIGGRFNPAAIVRSLLPLARRLHAERPFDVVDAQFFFPDGPAAAAIAKALGLPFSIKARGADIHHWGRATGTAEQVREAGLAAAGLLAVAEDMANDMAALGLPHENITIHRTGLDHDRFRPLDRLACRQQLGLPMDAPLLVTVGALIPRKGQAFVLDALERLPGAHLALAGAGPDEAELRARAARPGLKGRVHFLGSVAHDQLPLLLSAADVFVLPSASEGLANAWVEALACGTPVVTTNIGGARELITHADYGRLTARDGAAIAKAVLALLENPPSPASVAKGAAAFSWEANGKQLVSHWKRLAATAA
jgi:teichuronic acid biosynthesis glycosyltransferase TuaC